MTTKSKDKKLDSLSISGLLKIHNASTPRTLKSWKGSKAILIHKIEALPQLKKKPVAKKKSAAQLATDNPGKAYEKISGKKLPQDGVKSAAQWAKELGKNPKVVRAKLRRADIPTKDYKEVTIDSKAYKIIESISPRGLTL